MTSWVWLLVNIWMLAFFGTILFIFGVLCGMRTNERDYFNWANGWDDCRNAIKEGLSEEGKALVDKYTGKDEENEDI